MKTYEVSNASVSTITSVREISSSTSEKPARRRERSGRPADIVVIAESLFAEERRQAAGEGHVVLRPGDGERHGNLAELARGGGDHRREVAAEREAVGEARGEALAGERAGEIDRLGLGGVGLERAEILQPQVFHDRLRDLAG